MKITITTLTDHFFTLEVAEDMELENFKALCEAECGIVADQMVLMHEGKPLLDGKKDLKSLGIKNNDVLLVQKIVGQQLRPSTSAVPQFDFSRIQIPEGQNSRNQEDPSVIRDMLLSNPEQLALLRHNNPRLAASLDKGPAEFATILREQQKERAEQERQRIRMLLADPFDPETQLLIANEIQRQEIDSNMEAAMEYHPENFGQVTMLYIDCKVNGHPVKAFIDSGAQSTIMSKACASRCNIMRLIDSRWSGIAKGVGVQRIIGRIHLCQLQIENDFLASSFTILEEQPMDMLLGLDMLKRHQCSIDLKSNILLIGTTGTSTRFLNESEIPEFAKHKSNDISQHDGDAALAEAINRSVKDAHSTQKPSQSSSVSSAYSEDVIDNLKKMGFSREQVIAELDKFSGNQQEAMASLLAKSLFLPK